MKRISTLLPALFFTLLAAAQSDSLDVRLVLIGDAGDTYDGKHHIVEAVRKTTPLDKKTTVLYLGDNIYSQGLPDEQYFKYLTKRNVLDTEIAIANGTPARVFFIPGNHDWGMSGPDGWEAIKRQQHYVDSRSGMNVKFYPEEGCPGPVEIPLSDNVTLIVFDSQWWIHPYDKPGVESDCPYKTKIEVLSQMEDLLSKNSKKLVILACHHPFKSKGIHGGYFTPKQYLFPFTDLKPNLYIPLPGIGIIYPIARGVYGAPEDLAYPAYTNMINDIQKVAKRHPNILFVAGHEHNLQYIKDSSFNYIISGSGSKKTRVSKSRKAPFTAQQNGYAVLEISKQKNVNLSFITVSDSIRRPFSENILNFSKLPAPKAEDSIPIVYVPYSADSISVAANKKFGKASGVKRFLNGDNYRDVWSTPVKLPVFRLNEMNGGMKITALGGGHQTRSLKLEDKNGKEYSLRSINKDLSVILPGGVQGSAAEAYIEDFISTAHPYAPLVVPPLAKAINVVVAKPRFFFVPNDPALGIYRPLFANTVCMLEEKEPTPKGIETKSFQKVVNKFLDDNDDRVDQPTMLRARMLDFLLADWDRHYDQWRFAEYDTGRGKLYYPIPRDRDQALTYSDGLLLKLASKNAIPFLKGFRKDIPSPRWLAYWARDIDRFFLNGLDSSEWRKTINGVTANLTDQVIDDAVKKLPPEAFALSGQQIADKLKSRRNVLAKAGMKYYKYLSKRVDIVGSNKKEYIKIESAGKNLQVRVYKKTGDTDSASIIYDRIFEPSVTTEVDIYGLNGNDVFEIDDKVKSPIKIRIIGGRGEDTFNLKGDINTYIYDLSSEKNFLAAVRNTTNRFSSDPLVNRYSTTGFNYDRYNFPNPNLGYNPEDGMMMGVGFMLRTYRFRKDPSTLQRLTTLYAPASGSYKFRYSGEFNEIIANAFDVVANGELGKPSLSNFFGIGNFTKAPDPNNIQFYRVRYNYVSGEVMLRKKLPGKLSVALGPAIYNYWNHIEDNDGKILSTPKVVGLDSVDVYKTKAYAGGKLNILLNNVNNLLLPTRGIYWNTDFSVLGGINRNSRPITSLTSDITLYSSVSDPPTFVTELRVGGGHIFSKDYEYFQALNLGQNNYLRGFRKNRFSGSSLAYGSLTLRIRLFDSKSYFLPGSVGLIVFDDVGKVWAENRGGNDIWHNSVGGGIYYTPFNMVLLSGTVAFSNEETLLNFSLGTKFNLTF